MFKLFFDSSLVDAAPVFSQFEGFVLGTFVGALGQEFATKEHSVVAQGIADDAPPFVRRNIRTMEPFRCSRTTWLRQASIVLPSHRSGQPAHYVAGCKPLRCDH